MRKIFLGSCLTILILCGVVFIVWIRPDLLPPSNRPTEINLHQLLITVDDFPSGWQVDGTPESVSVIDDDLNWGEDNIFAAFRTIDDQGFAYQYIFRFRNEAAAKYGLFWIKRQGILIPLPNDEVLAGWTYKSPIADDWLFGCSAGKVCTALVRYDEFIIHLIISMNPKYMSLDDLENLLKVIDGYFSYYFKLGNLYTVKSEISIRP